MADISYSACADRFSLQVEELARMNKFSDNLDNLYHNRIGTLYDEFNLAIPLRFGEEVSFLWNAETIESIKAAAKVVADLLNEIRLQPKPYQPKGIAEVKEKVKEIQKVMLQDMTGDFAGCACPEYCKEMT
jgi:hypothetical protein